MGNVSQLKPGEKVGPYRIMRKIGSGGMGEVYEAMEEELQRKVAIKILASEALSDRDMIDRFKNEGRALARIRHRNVVSLYTLGEYEGRSYMAMEFVDGLSVDEYFEQHPCGLKDIVEFFRQMLEGLACAHEAGITHRDIKPQNIVIDKSMTCKLIDFGIAKVHSEVQTVHTAANVVVGTANYLAPEIVTGGVATAQSDVYSLGVVFYTVLTSHTPFRGRSNLEVLEKIRNGKIIFNRREDLILPDDIKELIFKMTAKDLQRRYVNARDALADLNKINLDTLPPEFLLPTHPRMLLENRDEVLGKCRAQGFETSEVRLIVNLAINIESQVQETADITQKISIPQSIKLSEHTVNDAIQRYLMARSKLISRRIPVERARPRGVPLEWMTGSRPVILVLLLVTSIYFLALRKPVQSTEFSSSPSTQPARSPTQVSKLFHIGDQFSLTCQNFERGILSSKTDHVWTLSGIARSHLKYMDAQGAIESLFFPVRLGATSTDSFAGSFQDEDLNETWGCQIQEKGNLNVAAGHFDVVKVMCFPSGGPFAKVAFFYAPTVHHWVREEKIMRTGFMQVCDLLSVKLAK